MKHRSAVVRKKLKEKEEPEETLLTSAAKEDRHLVVRSLKDNSSSETFNDLSPALAGLFLWPPPNLSKEGLSTHKATPIQDAAFAQPCSER